MTNDVTQGSPGPSTDRHNDPVVDPTKNVLDLVAAAIERQDDLRASERLIQLSQLDVVKQRLDGIDTATEVLNETVNRVPTELQEAIIHLRELMEEKFASVAQQFAERDTRSERESRDNKVAVDAAFAAQKEAAAKQDESNAKAIDKSEAATTETINKLNDLFNSSIKALSDKIDDLKGRMTTLESRSLAVSDYRSEHRQGGQLNATYVGVIVAVIAILVGIAIAFHK